MIIKGGAPRDRNITKRLGLVLLLVLAIIALFNVVKNVLASKNHNPTSSMIFCGAENISNFKTFINGKHKFGNGHTQSKDYAYEGKYSSEINQQNQYSIVYEYSDYKPSDEIQITAWIKAKNSKSVYLTASSETNKSYYHQTNEDQIQEGQWLQRKLNITLPNEEENGPIKIFVYTSNTVSYTHLTLPTIYSV